MSFWVMPMVAANSAVAPPTIAMTAIVTGASANRKLSRTMR